LRRHRLPAEQRPVCLVLGGALPPTLIVALAIVEAIVYTLA
jgi:hypothetical protein